MEIDFVRLRPILGPNGDTESCVWMRSWLRTISMRSHCNMHYSPVSNLCDRFRVSHAHCVSLAALDARPSDTMCVRNLFSKFILLFVRPIFFSSGRIFRRCARIISMCMWCWCGDDTMITFDLHEPKVSVGWSPSRSIGISKYSSKRFSFSLIRSCVCVFAKRLHAVAISKCKFFSHCLVWPATNSKWPLVLSSVCTVYCY